MFKVTYTKRAVKALRKIPEPYRSRIQKAVKELPNGDIKKLTGEPGYRLRVGDWRIIYDIEHSQLIIEVINIGPRERFTNIRTRGLSPRRFRKWLRY